MTRADARSRPRSPPDGERQHSAVDALGGGVRRRCKAIANSTGERCQRDALPPIPYCGDHKHLLDDVDRERMGLNPPKSDG